MIISHDEGLIHHIATSTACGLLTLVEVTTTMVKSAYTHHKLYHYNMH